MRGALAALVAAVVVGGLGACSGGGGSSPLPRGEYVKKVNALCQPAAKKQDALQSPFYASAKEYATAVEKSIAIQDKLISDIKTLKPPAADQKKIDELLTINNQERSLFEDLATALNSGDQAETNRITNEIKPLEQQFDELARAYGLTSCATSS
jgi:hypothetical protein